MVIRQSDLGGDEGTARRVLARARTIAPCIASLDPESEAGKDAIAILKGVLAELPKAGSRRTRSMSRNGTSMSFEIASAFTSDDEAALRGLCQQASAAGAPVGSFPKPGIVESLWPEGEYS